MGKLLALVIAALLAVGKQLLPSLVRQTRPRLVAASFEEI